MKKATTTSSTNATKSSATASTNAAAGNVVTPDKSAVRTENDALSNGASMLMDDASTPEYLFAARLRDNVAKLRQLSTQLPEKEEYFYRSDVSTVFKVSQFRLYFLTKFACARRSSATIALRGGFFLLLSV